MFELVDTTLRDGEQTAGIVFGTEEKLEMVRLLNRIGVQWIEAGTPAMGVAEQEVLKEMLKINCGSSMIAWNRADKGDVEKSIACGFEYIHISLPVSDFHIEQKLKKSREWVLARLKEIAEYVTGMGAKLLVGAEDASHADSEFFLHYADVAAECGAIRVRYADTIGCMEPFEVAKTFTELVSRCSLPIEFHGHNDFGLAVANSVAAYQSGAPFVSVTAAGIGERAGNSSFEDFAGAMSAICHYPLHLKLEYLPRLTEIAEAAKMRKKCCRAISA
ncbi:homocitrate synthase [Lachnospiraceae bacterium ZAX-1]